MKLPYTIKNFAYKISEYSKTEQGRHFVMFAPGWHYNGNHCTATDRLSTMAGILKWDLRQCSCSACQQDLINLLR